jgi:F-type H+-transporting ATPase subunit a
VPFNRGENPVIHLPYIRIPFKAGACPASNEEEASLTAGCLDLSITKHVVMIFISAALLMLVFVGFSHKDRKQTVPHGATANILEMLILFVRNEIAIPNIGEEEAPKYTPYLLSAFFFILFMNLLGLIPWFSTATSNIGVTCALAVCTFVVTQLAGLRGGRAGSYFKHLATGGGPVLLSPLMIIIELASLVSKPFALTIRLFANMLAGHIVIFSLLGLIFVINHVGASLVAVPFAMAIYFLEIFVAFLQAYVFTLLSAVFIGMNIANAHHDHADDHPNHADAHGHHEAHQGVADSRSQLKPAP